MTRGARHEYFSFLTWNVKSWLELDSSHCLDQLVFCKNPSKLGSDLIIFPEYLPWKWQPTPVLLPGESHGWRSLVGYKSKRVGHDWATSLSLSLSPTLLGRHVLWNISKLLFFLSPSRKHKEIFIQCLLWKSSLALGGKSQKYKQCGYPTSSMTRSQWSFSLSVLFMLKLH